MDKKCSQLRSASKRSTLVFINNNIFKYLELLIFINWLLNVLNIPIRNFEIIAQLDISHISCVEIQTRFEELFLFSQKSLFHP